MADDQNEPPEGRGFGAGYAIVGAGFQLVFSILFFMGMGMLADRAAHTPPLFLLIGLAVGMAAGFYAFWRRVMAMSKEPRK
jgi:F0F1-type ATP synthase assembly protein I